MFDRSAIISTSKFEKQKASLFYALYLYDFPKLE